MNLLGGGNTDLVALSAQKFYCCTSLLTHCKSAKAEERQRLTPKKTQPSCGKAGMWLVGEAHRCASPTMYVKDLCSLWKTYNNATRQKLEAMRRGKAIYVLINASRVAPGKTNVKICIDTCSGSMEQNLFAVKSPTPCLAT